jgi:peptidoglycan L-alanyl-D-glutamate endopeptidase CwlK
MNTKSLDRLKECHPDLIKLIMRVDELYPCHVICGHRNEADQNKAFDEKKSQLKFPQSKHNSKPSRAVDVVSGNGKTIAWSDLKAFEILCLTIEAVAEEMNIKIRLGRDFSFKDWPHCELI